MTRAAKSAEADVKIRVTKDGVFIADNERRETGDEETVPADIAAALIESGHAKRA